MSSILLDSSGQPIQSSGATAVQADPILKVSGLTTSFRVDRQWVPVVRNLDFHINPRETVAVVGESGSGKSITALSIMRLIPEATGRVEGGIELDGISLPELSEPSMRNVRGGKIGMIFQEPMTSLNPVLTVGFQVAEVLQRHRDMDASTARTETLRLFDLVRIADAKGRLNEYPHTFSGGMRQRIMIAIALACQPRLLIADEPTTALDVTIQAQILELIRELQSEVGMAVMFITHDMGVVAEIADRVVVMLTGDKVEEGSTEALFAHPQHSYTRKLLAAVPRLGSLSDTDLPRRFVVEEPVQTGDKVAVNIAEDEPDQRGDVILDVRNLSTRFPVHGGWLGRVRGQVHAVENVSFKLRQGETLALVGESGCGKSTTGRSILQLLKPASGEIRFENTELTTASPEILRKTRQRIQMIFQDPYGSLNPRKTVGAAIREPMIVHGLQSRDEADQEVLRLLDTVGLLPEHALRFPHEFSGGQRQRLCIARCLAMQPQLIVADESVSALDVSIQAQVINLLLELQRELKLSYLFISHDIAVVERVSHRIAVMFLGEIVEIGPRRTILENPRHPYTQKLIAAAPIPDPSARRARAGLMSEELKSPVRPLDWQPDSKPLVQYGEDHWVRES